MEFKYNKEEIKNLLEKYQFSDIYDIDFFVSNNINIVKTEKIEDKKYSLSDACTSVRELKSAKFDESVEIALNLNVDPRHADQMIRGAVVLPNGTGKTVRVAVFA